MRKQPLILVLSAIMAFLSTIIARADYSNTVVSLNPVAYWPLNETVQPPAAYIATNSGTLGAAANGYYETWFNPDGNNGYTTTMDWTGPVAGATVDGDGAANFAGDPNRYIQIPRTFPGAILQAPFTVECWAYATNTGDWANLIGAGGQLGRTSDPNADWSGFNLNMYLGNWLFDIYNANSDVSALELSGPVTPGQWTYLVATFDGTNATLYVNGSEVDDGIPNTNAAGQYYVPDPANPILIGALNPAHYVNGFPGYIDEVAIYTNVLSAGDISTHYSDATAGGYAAAVLADKPVIYLRLDEPLYNLPAPASFASFPKANSYGSIGSAADGLYQPGTVPGTPGPSGNGFGPANFSVAINGMDAAVDVGNGSLTTVAPALNPTGTNAFSVVAWIKGNPADGYNRFQTILGHGDSGWRFGLGSSGPQFNPGGSGDLTYGNGNIYNDGRWHMVTGVYNGSTNDLYVDGTLVASAPNSSLNSGDGLDVLLGGAPDYTTPAGRYWAGNLAQVAYFTNALSAASITQLYAVAGIAPYILQQPFSDIVDGGIAYTNPVVVDGSAALSYQWYLNGSPVSGQTNANLVYNPVQGGNAGNYFVVATNDEGAVTSSVVALTVNTSPQITVQPAFANLTLFAGGSAGLSVQATGAQPLSYQWISNGVLVATNASYELTDANASASYVCIITNFLGSITSSVVSVTVIAQPTNTYPQAVLANNPIAYWRLDEPDQGYPNNGVVANDYWGGHDGIYTNTALGQTGYPAVPPDPDTAALFGANVSANSDMQAPGIDFAAPAGSNAEFSVEAWVFTTFPQFIESDGSGIITKGRGDGGEEFNLDTGSGGGDFRFFVRDASGGVHLCNSTIAADSNWHHLVGVCDEANGILSLYVDGTLAASTTITAGSGLQSTPNTTVSIGARQSGTGSYDDQFPGVIDEVAIYNYPLAAAQITTQYEAVGGFAPKLIQSPTNTTANVGTTATFSAVVNGSPVLAYQWYNVTEGSPGTAIPGATSDTLTLDDVTTAESGNLYELVVTNNAGSASTTPVELTVVAGPPVLQADIQPLFVRAFIGVPVTFSVTVGGTPPFHYLWHQDDVLVGPDTNTFIVSVLAGTNTYDCEITNANGSITSSVATIIGVALTGSGANGATNVTTFAVNFMDAANTVFSDGTNLLNQVFEGLGAYPDDPANTNWNGFGLPDGFPPTFDSSVPPQVASDGTLTPITLTLAYEADNGEIGSGPGGNTAQGEPSFILGQAAIVNSGDPGIGTSSDPLGGITFSNVPAGTYTLYLYGANFDGTRGASFKFNSGEALGGTNATANIYTNGGSGPLNSFVYGMDYVIFTNVIPAANGTITGTWGTVTNNGNSGEGDFNGLQLVRVSGPPVSNQPVLAIQLADGKVIVSWSPATGVLQSATDVVGPYTTVNGSTSPYTNAITGTQQFFRVNVP